MHVAAYPEIEQGTTAKYANWELVDPEKWTTDGYVCLRVDGRGSGRSPGKLDLLSARETKDFYECIEWAGIQRLGKKDGSGDRGGNGVEKVNYIDKKGKRVRRFGFHQFRHSLASFLTTKKKLDPKTAQTALRQSNVAFTLNLYTQTDNAELMAAQNMMLDAIFNTETAVVQ